MHAPRNEDTGDAQHDTEGTSETHDDEQAPSDLVEPEEGSPSLPELHRDVLDFESKFWKKTALKERAITDQLGLTPMRYYQILIGLLESPEAISYAPSTIRRLSEAYSARYSKKLQ